MQSVSKRFHTGFAQSSMGHLEPVLVGRDPEPPLPSELADLQPDSCLLASWHCALFAWSRTVSWEVGLGPGHRLSA